MRVLLFIFLLLFLSNCSSKKLVYWCGDHPCLNKKEKEAFFKKTMIVEIKDLEKEVSKNKSEIEKITQQAKIDEKKRINEEKVLVKEKKLARKVKKKEEKRLIKQAKLEKKLKKKKEKRLFKKAKKEKKLAKKIDKEEKIVIKKKMVIKNKKAEKKIKLKNITNETTNFSKIVEKITNKNTLRPYPDINDIPR